MESTNSVFVWIRNFIIIALCGLSIACYFLMPIWRISVSFPVHATTVQNMIGDSIDIDAEEVIGADSVKLGISLQFRTPVLFKSFGNEHVAVEVLIDDNIDQLVRMITDTLKPLTERALRAVADNHVSREVHKNIKNLLASSNPDITDEEVSERLNNAGITDEFISSKTNSIIDKIYGDGSNVDEICDEIEKAVDEVYAKMSESGDPDLQNAEFTEEEREAFRANVRETMENLSADDGTIDSDTLLAVLFRKAIDAISSGGSSDESAKIGAVPLAETEGETVDVGNRLEKNVRTFLVELVPESIDTVSAWILRGMTILFLFSTFWWVYILVKMIVKAASGKGSTVRLGTVLWLGWLPLLILVGVPTLALLLGKSAIMSLLPESMMSLFAADTSISFFSAGWIAAAAAAVCLIFSICNMVFKRKSKKKNSD